VSGAAAAPTGTHTAATLDTVGGRCTEPVDRGSSSTTSPPTPASPPSRTRTVRRRALPSHRKKHRAGCRKLAAEGDVVFEVVDGPDPRTPWLVDWMLTQKRVWSTRSGKAGAWVFDNHYREFLTRLATDPHPVQPVVLFVLHWTGHRSQ